MTPKEAFANPDRCEEFFELAARIFGADRASLDGTTAYESIPGWDSVNHLRLVMETEARYGTSIPLAVVPQLRKLADFAPYINPKDNS